MNSAASTTTDYKATALCWIKSENLIYSDNMVNSLAKLLERMENNE